MRLNALLYELEDTSDELCADTGPTLADTRAHGHTDRLYTIIIEIIPTQGLLSVLSQSVATVEPRGSSLYWLSESRASLNADVAASCGAHGICVLSSDLSILYRTHGQLCASQSLRWAASSLPNFMPIGGGAQPGRSGLSLSQMRAQGVRVARTTQASVLRLHPDGKYSESFSGRRRYEY